MGESIMKSLKLSLEEVKALIESLPSEPEKYYYLELLLNLPYPVYVEVIERLYSGEITLGVLSQKFSKLTAYSGLFDFTLGDVDKDKVINSNISYHPNMEDKSLESMILSSALNKLNNTMSDSQRLPVQLNESQKYEYLRRVMRELQAEIPELRNLSLPGSSMALLGESFEMRILLMDLAVAIKRVKEWHTKRNTNPNDMVIFQKFVQVRNDYNTIIRKIEELYLRETSNITS